MQDSIVDFSAVRYFILLLKSYFCVEGSVKRIENISNVFGRLYYNLIFFRIVLILIRFFKC